MIHIWIEDDINWENFCKNYSDIRVRCYSRGRFEVNATYMELPVNIKFYTKHQANFHMKYSLWCGREAQKVIINEDINHQSVLYLVTRLRSVEKPSNRFYNTKEKLIIETTEQGNYVDWRREDGFRDYKSCEGFKCAGDWLSFLEEVL